MEGGGFEPPKLTRQIYSLIPLATREPLQKEALDSAFGAGRCQMYLAENYLTPHKITRLCEFGAATKSRTRDLLITNQLLYQLSYSGERDRGLYAKPFGLSINSASHLPET